MSVDIWNCHPWPLDDSRCRCKIHLVTFLYIFLLLDCFQWDLIHCIEKWRVHSELWQFQLGGVHLPLVSTCFLYVLVFPYLTVSNGHSLTALKSIEVTQSSGSFKGAGVHLPLVSTCFLYVLVFPYLTVSNGHSLTALKSIQVTQSSGSFKGVGVHLPLVSTCFLYALIFPYIFLLFDCFEWVLIDGMKMHSCHFLIKQFQMGGTVCLWYLYPYIYWYFLIFSNKLTVSNGSSLTVWKCVAVTFSSSSF